MLAALLFAAIWESVAPGVGYAHIVSGTNDIHVARIDLTSDAIRVIATSQGDRDARVSDFAKKRNALIAINGDYFDDATCPIGLAIGACGQWVGTKDTAREGVVAVGDGRARIDAQRVVMDPPEEWVAAAVSGWPLLVDGCTALTAKQLPGSDGFTRAPHSRTAAGLSGDGKTLYLVVADGRRQGVPGLTLEELATFMKAELGVCSAINLDGGGSSAMWVCDRIVNKPSDGFERRVANHLAVVWREDAICGAVESRLHK
ncbi:MAG TPA: phosphodiester glycosidase family protein [Thermoanaerobaculia bacterium]|nr:phosphodiester glycosidase family protein [Thermoanaerobaculia bacterium]